MGTNSTYATKEKGIAVTDKFVSDVTKFAEICGHTTDQFNVRQTALYIGLQLEEMAEKLGAVFSGDESATGQGEIIDLIFDLSHDFKAGYFDSNLFDVARKDLLDADVDLAWVTIGSMLSQGADVLGAIGEVTRANMDKFPGGVVTKDGNGKVKKPDGWKGPDLSEFVCK